MNSRGVRRQAGRSRYGRQDARAADAAGPRCRRGVGARVAAERSAGVPLASALDLRLVSSAPRAGNGVRGGAPLTRLQTPRYRGHREARRRNGNHKFSLLRRVLCASVFKRRISPGQLWAIVGGPSFLLQTLRPLHSFASPWHAALVPPQIPFGSSPLSCWRLARLREDFSCSIARVIRIAR